MTDANTPGALTQSELQDLWTSVVDPLYAQPLLDLGDGYGLEARGQLQAQLARASQAVDTTTQSLYLRDWSGKTSSHAMGDANATVTLTVQRTGYAPFALQLTSGQFVVQEQTNDYGVSGSTPVMTGRRYILTQTANWAANDTSAKTVTAIAEKPGYGYNNPMPGTIKVPAQVGSGFNNTGATVSSGNLLIVRNTPSVVIPDHVGQYIKFTAGSNVGQVRRVVAYNRPDLNASPPTGGSVVLDGAALTPESGTAAWKVLDWVSDWGITASNATSPTGGRKGFLDALGLERGIRRASGESDDNYRDRVTQIADVVSPNALRRAANRFLSAYSAQCTLRETCDGSLFGAYFDGDSVASRGAAFAFDTPAGDWKCTLSFLEFRAFFAIQVPYIALGDFGMAYDVGTSDAYDLNSSFNFGADGYPLGTSRLYKAIYDATRIAHAGGVSFRLIRKSA